VIQYFPDGHKVICTEGHHVCDLPNGLMDGMSVTSDLWNNWQPNQVPIPEGSPTQRPFKCGVCGSEYMRVTGGSVFKFWVDGKWIKNVERKEKSPFSAQPNFLWIGGYCTSDYHKMTRNPGYGSAMCYYNPMDHRSTVTVPMCSVPNKDYNGAAMVDTLTAALMTAGDVVEEFGYTKSVITIELGVNQQIFPVIRRLLGNWGIDEKKLTPHLDLLKAEMDTWLHVRNVNPIYSEERAAIWGEVVNAANQNAYKAIPEPTVEDFIKMSGASNTDLLNEIAKRQKPEVDKFYIDKIINGE
jgi:hypothetical protein